MSTTSESFLVGLIGDGVTASLTPQLHEHEARCQGLSYLYRPIDLSALDLLPSEVPRLLRAGAELGFNAFNVTHPVKQTVMEHLDEIDADAAALGAVNTVLLQDGKLIGYNTDSSGYLTGLRNSLGSPDLSCVVQLGTGGAGSAVAYALLQAGASRLVLCDLDEHRCRERVSRLQVLFPHQEIVAISMDRLEVELLGATGFAQCTPVGMSIHPGMPLDIDFIHDGTWVSDVIYRPRDTEFIVAARERGLSVVDGGGMAVGQAADAFELITGQAADSRRMAEHFEELVAEEDRRLNGRLAGRSSVGL